MHDGPLTLRVFGQIKRVCARVGQRGRAVNPLAYAFTGSNPVAPSLSSKTMHIRELLNGSKPTLSFEFFPPKDDIGFWDLYRTIESLKPVNPSYVSVTYGAGGSSRKKTLDLVARIKSDIGIESMAHLTCVGPPEHISNHRENVKLIEIIEADLLAFERLAAQVQRVSPRTTWRMIVIIAIFLGVLSLGYFFVWQRQLKAVPTYPGFDEEKGAQNATLTAEQRKGEEERKVEAKDIEDILKKEKGEEDN